MIAPPPGGDPYESIPPDATNPGSQGAAYAWDQLRAWWTTGAQTFYGDLSVIVKIGP
jgi:hypothetical protein